MSSGKPLILLNLYLDADSGGTQHLALKTVTFHEVVFTAAVINFGMVDRSIPYPPGAIQIDDATVEVADTYGQIREWFAAVTPFKRIGEIIFDFESDTDALSLRDLPVSGMWRSDFGSQGPMSDPAWKPLFTGEIVGVEFGPGTASIKLREIMSLWLGREIPKLIIRDNFPNLPDDVNEGDDEYTAPIIFGVVRNYPGANYDPQGVIKCHHVDTTLHRYCVARHECYAIHNVYRKKKLDSRYHLVSPSEYTVESQTYIINGVSYPFTFIRMHNRQEDGTIINAEVTGIPYRKDLTTGAVITGIIQRNVVDSLYNLIYYLLATEVNEERFQRTGWVDTRQAIEDLGYHCDGAITRSMTAGMAISQMCSDFGIDFYQTNQDQLTLRYYQPEDDQSIPVDYTLTLKKTFRPSLPEKLVNRLRYRYFHQNAHLEEYTKSSASGQWGFEETLDNLNDQAELGQTGKLPLDEEVVELFFVRDDADALVLMKTRMGYHTLRSYLVEFDLPAPEVIAYLQLATPLSLNHVQGIGPMGDGWVDKIAKVVGLAFDLRGYVVHTKAIVFIDLADTVFLASYPASRHARDAQVRFPQLPVSVNSSLDPVDPTIQANVDPPINLNDTDPGPPDSALETSTDFTYSFTSGDVVTTHSSDAGFVNVKWQEDQTTSPRKVSGYVPIPNFRQNIRFYVGSLYPDTRPTTLTDDDIYKVIFYSKDFNHEYFWVGTSETGTPSGWMIIGEEPGDVRPRIYSPVAIGWHLCNGAANIRISDYKGDTSLITVPSLTGGVYLKFVAAYDGPAATAAVAPGATAASAGSHSHPGSTVSSHTHSFSATAASAGAHTHPNSTTLIDPGHTHSYTGIGGGTTSSDGAHDHGAATANDGTHTHSGATGPSAEIDLTHHHSLSGVTTDGYDLSHSHTASSLDGTIFTASSEGDASADSPLSAADAGDSVHITGSTDSSLGSHAHSITGQNTGDADIAVDIAAVDVTVPSTGSSHQHAISSGGAHTHTFTTSGGSGTTGNGVSNISVSVSVQSDGAHTHSVTGTSDATAPSVSIAADGSHIHTITVDTTGEPKHEGLLPYLRL